MTPTIGIFESYANEIDVATLYSILRLRSEVLVVEQHAPYLDLDGKDLDATTIHIWAATSDAIVGTVRLLEQADGTMRMGRLCTAYHARGHGVARRLVARVLEFAGDMTVETHTQTNLAPWFERFGFVEMGPIFHEVGIPHTPMKWVP